MADKRGNPPSMLDMPEDKFQTLTPTMRKKYKALAEKKVQVRTSPKDTGETEYVKEAKTAAWRLRTYLDEKGPIVAAQGMQAMPKIETGMVMPGFINKLKEELPKAIKYRHLEETKIPGIWISLRDAYDAGTSWDQLQPLAARLDDALHEVEL
jgi:hypothetical protein